MQPELEGYFLCHGPQKVIGQCRMYSLNYEFSSIKLANFLSRSMQVVSNAENNHYQCRI